MKENLYFAGIKMKNCLIASSSPLTETMERIQCCYDAGFGGVILKTAAEYHRTGKGYGRKVVFLGDSYWADSSFEREILAAQEGIHLYKSTFNLEKDMLIIPSITACSENAKDWISICNKFEQAGAKLVQLDFFYVGSTIKKEDKEFYKRFRNLLSEIKKNTDCIIIPKLNFNFDPELICNALVESEIRQVSLLDSIRFPLPERFGLHADTTSYFGKNQLPITIEYLHYCVKFGLEVCAGGGVNSANDVDRLLENGAKLVQTASYILKNGFEMAPTLLHKQAVTLQTTRNTWCDAIYGTNKCEKCGFCFKNI